MRHVVLDTNCLIQMLSRHSDAYLGWRAFREERYVLCVSNDIISEYAEVIGQLATPEVAENVVNAILHAPNTKRFDPYFRFGLIAEDSDDNKFVDCAIIANADYIVSDDAHFNVLSHTPFPSLRVLHLKEFLADIQSCN